MPAEPDKLNDSADNVVVPDRSAPYAECSSEDPFGDFDIERAAQFIDGVAVKWGVKHGCVTCHTNGHYLEERQRWIDELLGLQKASGGWASGDLGRWRQRAPETGGYSHLDPELIEREFPPVMVDPNGDGYGTGFVLYALLQAGVPASHNQMQKGLAWLKSNQQADGKWFTNSLRNESDTSNFLTHTGTTFALMVLAETI
jgi:hypothetical protein